VYSVGQAVIYGGHGVCTVVEIEEKTVDHKQVSYYSLEPQTMPGTRFYIPVHNALAVSKMRLPLSVNSLQEMLRTCQPDMDLWIVSENARKLHYKELLSNCEPDKMLQTVRLLRLHREAQYAAGRKFHVCDANFLKSAETLLSAEIAFILGVDKEEAFKLI